FDDTLHMWHNGDSLELVHFDPAHTDTDIYIHFHKADVLHVGDTWFNGMYPFIDEGTGGSIGGMIRAGEKALAVAGNETKSSPATGHSVQRQICRSSTTCSRRFETRWPLSRPPAPRSRRPWPKSPLRNSTLRGQKAGSRLRCSSELCIELCRRHTRWHAMPSPWPGSL